MSDIVERLKDHESEGVTQSDRFHLRNEAADEIERLRAELERIGRIPAVRDRAGVGDGSVYGAVVAVTGALVVAEAERDGEIERLRAELADAKKDADRYRYIRDNHETRGSAMEIVYGMNGCDWDKAIDAALREAP